jgi:hypothetical protein
VTEGWIEICPSAGKGDCPVVDIEDLKVPPGSALAKAIEVATNQSSSDSKNKLWQYSLKLSTAETREMMALTLFQNKHEDSRCATFPVSVVLSNLRFDLTLFIVK